MQTSENIVRTINHRNKKSFFKKLVAQKELVLITLPFLILLIVFNYVPLWGWLMAFQDYKPVLGIQHSAWVGLQNFREIFTDPDFYHALRNTLGISILKFIFGFLTAITLAVLINEVRSKKYKKVVQTISYLPHFVSWVVAANIVYNVLSADGGIVNTILVNLHIVKHGIGFMGIPKAFWFIMMGSDVWKEVGWNSIIYLSAMTAIDSELYEAASIDGAGRLKKIFSITLPSIVPTIKILMILSIGSLLSVGFEQTYLLSNPSVIDYSQTLELYVYNYGIPLGRISFATAAGIFNSVVALILVTSFNRLSKMIDGESAF
ncbi:ABC transporter permease [Clostridium oryzae]|uniref:Putative multiple-sugar transport system permease YteP n=1 Tax=Clostridium oryzae TaxID=1450648 RepID=A0A1V4I9D9_9CLOT|nr:ABC transporter permease subunit [Clostridium oryzae]OPJ56611.1 putative multiple-sugar transport system permease YteP [Clostridium oryzae]